MPGSDANVVLLATLHLLQSENNLIGKLADGTTVLAY